MSRVCVLFPIFSLVIPVKTGIQDKRRPYVSWISGSSPKMTGGGVSVWIKPENDNTKNCLKKNGQKTGMSKDQALCEKNPGLSGRTSGLFDAPVHKTMSAAFQSSPSANPGWHARRSKPPPDGRLKSPWLHQSF